MKSRHKWDGVLGKTVDGGVQSCLKCGCTREVVASKIIYFINDTVYHKSPNCITKST